MHGRLVGIVLSLAVLPTAASGETWRASSGTDEATAYIDVDSIRRNGDRVSYWREVRWPSARTLEGGLRFDRVANFYEADCRGMEFRSLQLRARLGEEIVLSAEEPGEVEQALPGTTAESDLRAVCFDSWQGD